MQMTNTTITRIVTAATQSKWVWIWPAVTTLAILVAGLGVTGCDGGHPH